jgi:gliding motility-associated lipoprotein GldD
MIQKDLLFGEIPAHPCWFNISFPLFGATIYCSYYPLTESSRLENLIDDAYTMVSKHNPRATFRNEVNIQREDGAAVVFQIEGPVATPVQFYVTDQKDHFLRGSLYFDGKTERDSIEPMIDFLSQDIRHILGQLSWN